jgi:hypothetical protein
MRRALCVVLMLSVSATPVWADVLPVKRAPKSDDRAKIAGRMQELGVPAAEAAAKAARMSPEDASFFASGPQRMQMVGTQDYFFSGEADPSTWEIVGGVGMVLLTLGGLRMMIRNNEHN